MLHEYASYARLHMQKHKPRLPSYEDVQRKFSRDNDLVCILNYTSSAHTAMTEIWTDGAGGDTLVNRKAATKALESKDTTIESLRVGHQVFMAALDQHNLEDRAEQCFNDIPMAWAGLRDRMGNEWK